MSYYKIEYGSLDKRKSETAVFLSDNEAVNAWRNKCRRELNVVIYRIDAPETLIPIYKTHIPAFLSNSSASSLNQYVIRYSDGYFCSEAVISANTLGEALRMFFQKYGNFNIIKNAFVVKDNRRIPISDDKIRKSRSWALEHQPHQYTRQGVNETPEWLKGICIVMSVPLLLFLSPIFICYWLAKIGYGFAIPFFLAFLTFITVWCVPDSTFFRWWLYINLGLGLIVGGISSR